jgi:hypothetical protein
MKCDNCGKKIEVTFMNKIIGTYYTKGKKKKVVCPQCQKLPDIKEKIKL